MNKTVGLGVSLLLLASCTDKVGEEVNGMATDGYSVMLRHDFEYEDGTRVSLTRKDKGVSCVWEEGDEIGVFPIAPESGTQSRMTIKKNDNYKDAHYAEFSGGGWKLNPQNTYAAYYPYNASLASDANHTSVRIDLSGQKQTGNGSMAHLSKYDYMYAPSTFAVEKDEYGWEHVVAFDFHHAVSIMELKLKVPVAATWTNLLIDAADYHYFPIYADMDATTGEIHNVIGMQSTRLALENVTTKSADVELTLYVTVLPVEAASHNRENGIYSLETWVETCPLTVAANTADGRTYYAVIEGKNQTAGKIYRYNTTLKELPKNYNCVVDGHRCVDLGLPSGTKWAAQNFGASNLLDIGKLYRWGETAAYGEPMTGYPDDWSNNQYDRNPNYRAGELLTLYDYVVETSNIINKKNCTWCFNSYKWGVHHVNGYSSRYMNNIKYSSEYSYLSILQPEDDVATMNWGEKWHIPVIGDFFDLTDNCLCVHMDYPKGSGKLCYFYFKAKNKNDKNKTVSVNEAKEHGYTMDDPYVMFTRESMLFDFPTIDREYTRYELSFWTAEMQTTVPNVFTGGQNKFNIDATIHPTPHPIRAVYKE